ncbi:MAG: protein kinase, partial [Elusimicrobia bacterium]|nr:protein kinase [Elusimicrobiota bacterium]
MKPIPLVHAAAALAVLSTLFAAPPSEAGLFCWGRKCIAKKEVKQRAGREFEELREEVKTDYKEDPLLDVYISNIDATRKRFDSQADAVLKREKYNDWEFDYIGQRVTKVLIPTIKKAVVASAAMPEARREAVFTATLQNQKQATVDFDQNFIRVNSARMLESATDPSLAAAHENAQIEQSINPPASGQTGAETTDDAAGRYVQSRGRYGSIGPRLTPEQMLVQSDVARLAEASAKYVLDPTAPQPPDGGDGGGDNGGGNNGGGGVRPPRPSRPTGNWPKPGTGSGSGGSGGSVIDSIVSPAGVSQIFATRGIDALASRNYAEALALSQRALALDASNRSAMEIYQSVKGRGDAAGVGASGASSAKANAAALGSPGFEPGGVDGAAGPMSSVAAAGAARLAGDQARAASMNAMKLGDATGALEILTKALNQDPNNPALLNLRAQAYGRLGRWEDAIKDAAAGLALAPGNMALLSIQALAQNRTRRWRDALATSEQILAADPKSAWGYANRAHAWAGLGQREAMLADINRAAALDPRFRQAAEAAALLQLPSEADVMFLFPGESAKGGAPAPAPAGRGKSFGVVVGAGAVGGLLLALGLLSTVLAPLKNTVVSVFTKARRTAPATNSAVATAQPASVAGNVGGLIRGQYEISRQIGAGGMGMVYEGTDRSLGRRVAIKKMRDELRVNARERDRFIIEAKTVASLHHPNIVDIYAIAEEGEDVYLVFEYVDGKTVHDLVQLKGRLDPAESVRVTRAMGEALTYAHSRGVIHRDMKPSNVMLTGAGQVKVMDFGIARMAKDALTRYSMTNTVVGTPPYMAPEQEQGVVRKESDVYSLAVCAYEMLTGKMPFIGIGAGMLMNKINMSYIPPSRAIA